LPDDLTLTSLDSWWILQPPLVVAAGGASLNSYAARMATMAIE
jgi:hypothetical protein